MVPLKEAYMNSDTEKKNKKEYDLAPLKRVIKAYKEEYPIGFSLGYIFTQIETLPDKMQEVETEEKLYLSLFLLPNKEKEEDHEPHL